MLSRATIALVELGDVSVFSTIRSDSPDSQVSSSLLRFITTVPPEVPRLDSTRLLASDLAGGAKAVFTMDQRQALDAAHLREILTWVLSMHGEVRPKLRHSSAVHATLQAEGCPEVAVHVDFRWIEKLAEDVRIVTAAPDISRHTAKLGPLMADIATTVNSFDQFVSGQGYELSQLNPLTLKIRAEFSIASAIAFAAAYGYRISTASLPSDRISLALVMKDWPRLNRIFEETLHQALPALPVSSRASRGQESPESLIRDLEMKFADASPIPSPEDSALARQLSGESLANLRSVAEQENWTRADVFDVLEEHLRPVPSSNVLYHSSTVSGADWHRLLDWLHGKE